SHPALFYLVYMKKSAEGQTFSTGCDVVEFGSTTSICNTLNHALLRFRQVAIMTTCFTRNTLTIRPLAAGIAAIERI
ncbi:hypothetical protein, partial [Pseudoflavonifractor sp. 524-17]|uniref:hypothetical protein n=1 Tax=Pseudoflavonifractor sp. 524-17 TaxID=2304577 RepID=UPI001A9BF824